MANEIADGIMAEALVAATFVAKYGAIIVLSDLQPHVIFPLLLGRLNIYTDPQRPMTAEQGIYPLNNPDENSPVLVTCNFSLTYFIVSGEIESSRVPSWLCVQDTEGLSVMTAWAAGKFSGESVGTFINKCGIKDKVKHNHRNRPEVVEALTGRTGTSRRFSSTTTQEALYVALPLEKDGKVEGVIRTSRLRQRYQDPTPVDGSHDRNVGALFSARPHRDPDCLKEHLEAHQ